MTENRYGDMIKLQVKHKLPIKNVISKNNEGKMWLR